MVDITSGNVRFIIKNPTSRYPQIFVITGLQSFSVGTSILGGKDAMNMKRVAKALIDGKITTLSELHASMGTRLRLREYPKSAIITP